MKTTLSERLCANCRLRSLNSALGWEPETNQQSKDAVEDSDWQAERIQYSFGPEWKW